MKNGRNEIIRFYGDWLPPYQWVAITRTIPRWLLGIIPLITSRHGKKANNTRVLKSSFQLLIELL